MVVEVGYEQTTVNDSCHRTDGDMVMLHGEVMTVMIDKW